MDVMRAALAAEVAGRSIMHMEVGQPGTPAPKAARDSGSARARGARRSATPWRSATMRCVRASHSTMRMWYGVRVAPERIAVTAGSSAAFVLAFLAMFDAGDAVALPSPGYPCYRHILSALGQRSVLLETGPATDWMPTRRGCRAGGAPRRDQGAADRQPRQSDRHDDLGRAHGRAGRRVPRAWRAADLGRDLPWAHVRARRRDGAGATATTPSSSTASRSTSR